MEGTPAGERAQVTAELAAGMTGHPGAASTREGLDLADEQVAAWAADFMRREFGA